jgi:hypothetical protein
MNRNERIATGGVLLGGLVLGLLSFDPTPHTGGDSAAYLTLGRALAEAGEYRSLWDPDRPPHTLYPPVFPALLALAMLLGVKSWVALKLLMVGFATAALGVSLLWARRFAAAAAVAWCTAVLLVLSPGVHLLSHWLLADMPFWLLTVMALLAFGRAGPDGPFGGVPSRDETPHASPDRRWLAAAIGLTLLALFTRSAGLPLALAACVWLGLRRRYAELAVAAAVLFLPVALWSVYVGGSDAGYIGPFWWVDPYRPERGTIGVADFGVRVVENVARYLSVHLPGLLTGGMGPGLGVAILVVALAMGGWALRLKRPGVVEVWTPLYIGLLLAWPTAWGGDRLLLPLLPVLLLYALEAAARLGGTRHARTGAVALTVLVGAAGMPGLAAAVQHGTRCTGQYRAGEPFPCMGSIWRELFTVARSMRGALPEGSAVLSRKPTLVYALSGYPGRLYPMSTDPDVFFEAAQAAGAKYVILDQAPDLAPVYLHPVLLARRDRFCVMPGFVFGEAALLRIEPVTSPGGADRPANAFRACVAPAGDD